MALSVELAVNVVLFLAIVGIVLWAKLGGPATSGKSAGYPAPRPGGSASGRPAPPRSGGSVNGRSSDGESARPSSKAKSVAAASEAAGVVDAASKVAGSKRYNGEVKRYSERNGIGFVSCEATREKYGKDVRIFREDYESKGLQVGDPVTFNIVLEGRQGCPRGQPWAANVRCAEDDTSGPCSAANGARLRGSSAAADDD